MPVLLMILYPCGGFNLNPARKKLSPNMQVYTTYDSLVHVIHELITGESLESCHSSWTALTSPWSLGYTALVVKGL